MFQGMADKGGRKDAAAARMPRGSSNRETLARQECGCCTPPLGKMWVLKEPYPPGVQESGFSELVQEDSHTCRVHTHARAEACVT